MRAEASVKPVLPGKRRTAWQSAVGLYQGQSAFRGFAEFALIGAVVLYFLHGVDFKAFHIPSFGSSQAVAPPSSAGSSPAVAPASNAVRSSRLPTVRDVMFDGTYFAERPEPLRAQLVDATAALKGNDLARVEKVLGGADPTDRWVQLVRGTAAISSPDPRVFASGLELLKQSASHADPKAMSILGVVLITGYGGQPNNVDRGRQYLEQAVAVGDTTAARVLAAGYFTGWAGRVDLAAAASLMHRAAEQGDTEAMFQYAIMLVRGIGIGKDSVEGQTWLLKAAELGHPGSQSEFGHAKLIDYSRQLTTDAGPAIKWLSRAAEQGEADAMYSLGRFYVMSKPSTGYRDAERGVQLLQKCSEETMDSRCMFSYAALLEEGMGAPVDPVRAYAFYRLSEDAKGTRLGAERLANLEKQLPSADLEKGRALSRQIRERFFARIPPRARDDRNTAR
jgi:TPR repeat protein